MKNLNQKGSVHVILVTCLVIALLFALGWIFWRNFVYKEPVKTNSQLLVVKPKTTSSTDSTPTSTTKYLTVKEWGVQFPYQGDDTLTYNGYSSYGGSSSSISIISAKLAKEYDGNCATTGSGGIMRGVGTDTVRTGIFGSAGGASNIPTFAEFYNRQNTSDSYHQGYYIGKSGNYYYAPVTPQNTCTSSDGNSFPTTSENDAIQTLIQSAVKNVESAN